jgi:hypothetical protein
MMQPRPESAEKGDWKCLSLVFPAAWIVPGHTGLAGLLAPFGLWGLPGFVVERLGNVTLAQFAPGDLGPVGDPRFKSRREPKRKQQERT